MSKLLKLSNGNYTVELIAPVYIPTVNGLIDGWKTKLILPNGKKIGSMTYTENELKLFKTL